MRRRSFLARAARQTRRFAGTLLLAACALDAPLTPAAGDTGSTLQLRLQLLAADSPGLTVRVRLEYERQDGTRALLGERLIPVADQRADALTPRFDLAPCLADPARRCPTSGPDRQCRVHPIVALERVGGILDLTTGEPIWMTPGNTTALTDAFVLFEVATVQISDATGTLLFGPVVVGSVGARTRLTAIARDASGTLVSGRAVVWSSNEPAIVSVAPDGDIEALAVGSARITAVVGGRAGLVTLVVEP
jgi:hypothetical protein